jgi:hypothetical protein
MTSSPSYLFLRHQEEGEVGGGVRIGFCVGLCYDNSVSGSRAKIPFSIRRVGTKRMAKIFLDKRVWRNSRDNWVSFESDPRLRVTKTNIYGRCVPCITNLYQQLQEGKEEIELKEAYHCWKVVAVLKDKEECLEVLREYEENFLGDHYVKGKFGSSLPTKPTKVLMFHIENEGERDRILKELRACVQKVNPTAKVFYQRACANLYYDLLGDWKEWGEVTRIKNPDVRPMLSERIKKLLYWEKEKS